MLSSSTWPLASENAAHQAAGATRTDNPAQVTGPIKPDTDS